MAAFNGFPEGKQRLTPIPELFFSQLLPHIDHLGELKLSVYVFWRLDKMEGAFHYLRREDFSADAQFMGGLDADPRQAEVVLVEALQRAVQRGTLLQANLELKDGSQAGSQAGSQILYFLNSPTGRAAQQAIQAGRWRQTGQPETPIEVGAEAPNIFRLYEENFGPLSPLIAETLGEAEDTYPGAWIEEAMRIAVEKNTPNWPYLNAIRQKSQRVVKYALKQKPEDPRDSEETRRRYVEGEFSDFVEH